MCLFMAYTPSQYSPHAAPGDLQSPSRPHRAKPSHDSPAGSKGGTSISLEAGTADSEHQRSATITTQPYQPVSRSTSINNNLGGWNIALLDTGRVILLVGMQSAPIKTETMSESADEPDLDGSVVLEELEQAEGCTACKLPRHDLEGLRPCRTGPNGFHRTRLAAFPLIQAIRSEMWWFPRISRGLALTSCFPERTAVIYEYAASKA